MYRQFIPAEFNHSYYQDGRWISSYVDQFKKIKKLIDDSVTTVFHYYDDAAIADGIVSVGTKVCGLFDSTVYEGTITEINSVSIVVKWSDGDVRKYTKKELEGKIRKAKIVMNQKTAYIVEELDKLKVNTDVEQDNNEPDKKAWRDIWISTNNIVDMIRTAVGIDKIYYDKKIKETKTAMGQYEVYNAPMSDDVYFDYDIVQPTLTEYTKTINNNLTFLPKIAIYNLKLVVEVVKDSSTEQEVITLLKNALGGPSDLKEANKKALDFAIFYIRNPNLPNKEIQDLEEKWNDIRT